MAGLAIVTGAAGGMGAPTATRLAEQGFAAFILCDMSAERLEQVAAPLRAVGHDVALLADDIADAGFIDRLMALVGDREIAALVHTAGLSPTMADPARILAVNYDATDRLVEAVRPRMAAGACAVLISSSSGYQMKSAAFDAALDALGPGDDSSSLLALVSHPGAAYALSKRGVIRMVAQRAAAFGARGARIASIAPGLIDTAMSRAEQKATTAMDAMLAKTPLARYGSGDEIATVAAFLCSPAASFVSGIDIPVDGGVLAAMGAL